MAQTLGSAGGVSTSGIFARSVFGHKKKAKNELLESKISELRRSLSTAPDEATKGDILRRRIPAIPKEVNNFNFDSLTSNQSQTLAKDSLCVCNELRDVMLQHPNLAPIVGGTLAKLIPSVSNSQGAQRLAELCQLLVRYGDALTEFRRRPRVADSGKSVLDLGYAIATGNVEDFKKDMKGVLDTPLFDDAIDSLICKIQAGTTRMGLLIQGLATPSLKPNEISLLEGAFVLTALKHGLIAAPPPSRPGAVAALPAQPQPSVQPLVTPVSPPALPPTGGPVVTSLPPRPVEQPSTAPSVERREVENMEAKINALTSNPGGVGHAIRGILANQFKAGLRAYLSNDEVFGSAIKNIQMINTNTDFSILLKGSCQKVDEQYQNMFSRVFARVWLELGLVDDSTLSRLLSQPAAAVPVTPIPQSGQPGMALGMALTAAFPPAPPLQPYPPAQAVTGPVVPPPQQVYGESPTAIFPPAGVAQPAPPMRPDPPAVWAPPAAAAEPPAPAGTPQDPAPKGVHRSVTADEFAGAVAKSIVVNAGAGRRLRTTNQDVGVNDIPALHEGSIPSHVPIVTWVPIRSAAGTLCVGDLNLNGQKPETRAQLIERHLGRCLTWRSSESEAADKATFQRLESTNKEISRLTSYAPSVYCLQGGGFETEVQMKGSPFLSINHAWFKNSMHLIAECELSPDNKLRLTESEILQLKHLRGWMPSHVYAELQKIEADSRGIGNPRLAVDMTTASGVTVTLEILTAYRERERLETLAAYPLGSPDWAYSNVQSVVVDSGIPAREFAKFDFGREGGGMFVEVFLNGQATIVGSVDIQPGQFLTPATLEGLGRLFNQPREFVVSGNWHMDAAGIQDFLCRQLRIPQERILIDENRMPAGPTSRRVTATGTLEFADFQHTVHILPPSAPH